MSKVTVSLPDDLLREIDDEARRRSSSRSAFLAAAAWRELARRGPADLAQAIARSEQRFRAAGGFDASELVRQERDMRNQNDGDFESDLAAIEASFDVLSGDESFLFRGVDERSEHLDNVRRGR